MTNYSKHKIFMVSGFTDVEVAGNQSFRNTIKYLSDFGYSIDVFTFMLEDYPNLQDPGKIFNQNVKFYRLPGMLSPVIKAGKMIKDLIGKRRVTEEESISSEVGTYLREYNFTGRIFYIIFQLLIYMPIELLRVMLFSLKKHPSLIYGVNCQGALVASIAGRMLRKPVVTRFQGTSLSKYDLKSFKSRIALLDEIIGLSVKSDAVISTNDGTNGDEILKLLNVDEEKIHFWMNGLDTEDLLPFKEGNRENFKKELSLQNKVVVLALSRLTSWKRVDRSIHCLNRLVNEQKREDIILLIGGDGPERKSLEKLVSDMHLSRYVRFCGKIPHKEVGRYFMAADIFISLYDVSNLANPLLEAMYFGLPIITIDDGTTNHLLSDGCSAMLASKDNLSDELFEKLKRLIENASSREKMGCNAKNIFSSRVFSWKDRIKIESNLLQNLIVKEYDKYQMF